jgi:hypothetical protein
MGRVHQCEHPSTTSLNRTIDRGRKREREREREREKKSGGWSVSFSRMGTTPKKKKRKWK